MPSAVCSQNTGCRLHTTYHPSFFRWMFHQLGVHCHLSDNFCQLYAFYVQIHLSFLAFFWWSHHLQLCKMLVDCGWLCHHSVVKYLYKVISKVHLYLGLRLSVNNCILPNTLKIYRCHKS